MGFLDKAKQAAEQAQRKLEETQQNFNKSQSEKAQQGGGQGAAIQYDKHGQPIQQDVAPAPPPTAQPADVSGPPTPPQSPEPGGPVTPAGPAGGTDSDQLPTSAGGPEVAPVEPAAPAPSEPEGEEASEPQTEPPKEGINQNPDPFRPIQ